MVIKKQERKFISSRRNICPSTTIKPLHLSEIMCQVIKQKEPPLHPPPPPLRVTLSSKKTNKINPHPKKIQNGNGPTNGPTIRQTK